jgi:3'-phosphoadenosine 5'-phosphosulfate sulfotransferase (PAPS reductase)/FAD synthetase
MKGDAVMTDQEFRALLERAPQNLNIQKHLMVTRINLGQYRRIAISYSGGSDSDTILDMMELVKPEEYGEVKYVFFDTGLEWDATHRHVGEVEDKYGIQIERRKAKLPIPAACKKYGIPCFDKNMSQMLAILQHNGFDFNAEGKGIEHLALHKRWTHEQTGQYAIKPEMKKFLTAHPPDFTISDKCCEYAKKLPAKHFYKEYSPDLDVQGVRKLEGGPRSSAYKSCFTRNGEGMDAYRPLFFWTNADKQTYKEWRGIRYSDCYEIWGFKRTGCVGCPCAAASVEQLRIAEQYEPRKVRAAYAVFGASYEYRARYNRFKRHGNQITLFEEAMK